MDINTGCGTLTVESGVVDATVIWLQYRQQFSIIKTVAQTAIPPWDWKRASHCMAPMAFDWQEPTERTSKIIQME